jgi:molecular chaperone IbpA
MAIMPSSGKHDPQHHTDRYTDPWGPKSPKDFSYPKIPKPEVLTITSLFPQFNRWAIGFDPMLDTFKQVAENVKAAGYPPYNIYKNKDTYVLELAVAGFAKEDLTISVKELTLTVEGELGAPQEEALHKGIATRDFKQDFVLAEYVVVKAAELKDGLLRITLEQELPEEKKAKTIKIS